ncbi:glycoside hydrolase family 108 protein [Arenibaculum pallidiluteum]|uniref:glycoside hydrolase family 108 protein n=1 Tax=Arenibaculum pallidiluteum TaxID=2812559 RepID=UPI001A956852|nr:glycosyl hydrolase 108 family protein [Arenibaculum pallidiluteum]
MTVDDIITEILRHEGWPRFTNHPADRGGPTKGGITLETLRRWRAPRSVIARDVEALDEVEVRAIYQARYVEEPGYAGIIDDRLRALVVDCAVLFGTDDASPWLQQAANAYGAGLKVDGQVGPKTLAAVNCIDPAKLFRRVLAARIRKHGRVVTDDAKARGRTSDQSLNAAGWLARAAEFLEA